ncbi:MAG: carbohydrate kinase [Planctomycetes bacterium]|nr:carbohydrate kinase [Planctomycetota bacterium]
MITRDRLQAILAAFPKLTIGLVGDLFLDRYLEIDPELHELSVETGLEAYQVTRVRNSPGALGTVINNLAALRVGRLVPVSVLGDDGQAYDLRAELARLPVELAHLLTDPGRKTPTYTKPLKRDRAGVWQELNRLDLRNREPLAAATEDRLLDQINEVFAATDGLIVLDQVNEEGWGVVAPRVREHLGRLARSRPEKLMLVDSRAHLSRFDWGTLKPNRSECLKAAGMAACDDKSTDIRKAALHMAARTGRTVFCTQGERGILVARPGGETTEVPAIPVIGPIDTVGAGDSATAGITASLLCGASDVEAATIGNLVASITVQQIGTTGTASPEQVLARWTETADQYGCRLS